MNKQDIHHETLLIQLSLYSLPKNMNLYEYKWDIKEN